MSQWIAPLMAAELAAPASASSMAAPAVAGTGFGNMVSSGLEEVNWQLMDGQADLQQLAVGDAQNLHQVMIRLETSRMPFMLMLQVRSRLLEAYQDVMRMPV